jgi:hypothetical protein
VHAAGVVANMGDSPATILKYGAKLQVMPDPFVKTTDRPK